MASREGQGMQIMVILSALVTVLALVLAFVFYNESNKVGKELEAARTQAANNDKGQKTANYKLAALKYAMGLATSSDVEAARSQAGAADADVDKWTAQYLADVTLVGDDPKSPKEGYPSIVGKLVATIGQKSQSLSDATKTVESIQTDKIQEVDNLTKAKEAAEKNAQTVTAEYTASLAQKTDQNNQQAQQLAAVKGQVDDQKKAADAEIAAKVAELAQAVKNAGTLTNSLNVAKSLIEEFKTGAGATFENADGKITWVNQRQRTVWIDLGAADGLTKQMTFSVFSQEQASAFKLVEQAKLSGDGREKVAKLSAKGRIEVVSITGPHEAECRILEDSASDPILPGDWIQTPAWSPGQHYGFALAGPMDIDDDGLDDTELIKNLIRLNGGTIDAELTEDGKIVGPGITVKTRYMVEGKIPTDSDADSKAILAGIDKMEDARKLNGVEKLSIGELLERMGWKPEEKTVGLSGRSDTGSGQFRRRSPGAAPAETKAPDSTSEPMTPAAPSGETPADPFGTK